MSLRSHESRRSLLPESTYQKLPTEMDPKKFRELPKFESRNRPGGLLPRKQLPAEAATPTVNRPPSISDTLSKISLN